MHPPLRLLLAPLALAVVAAVVGGCSGGGGGGSTTGASTDTACALFGRLDATADPLLEVGAADPDAFSETLDAAVLEYVAVLDQLDEVLPDDFDDDLERVRGAVEQLRFDDAASASAGLDEWRADECPPVTTTTT